MGDVARTTGPRPGGVPLLELLEGAAGWQPLWGDPAGVMVAGLAYDSRRVRPGDLFFCVPGAVHDGHEFAAEAAARGAVAAVVERPARAPIVQVRVASVRKAMGPISAAFFDHPSRSLVLVGVTGTNGKTTTAYLTRAALEAAGLRSGLVGTVEVRVGGESGPAVRTTPEAPEFQLLLARMREAGEGACVCEVSSHALAQHRVDGSHFRIAIFTGLSRDHLDFHGSMEEYFRAKVRLLGPELASAALVNLDSPWGERALRAARVPAHGYSLRGRGEYGARLVATGKEGSRFVFRGPGVSLSVELPLVARFNVANAVAALATAHLLGLDLEAAARGVAAVKRVRGRVEPVDAGQPFCVLVDYAHTPDALFSVLRAAREMAEGRVAVVFGAGGERDRGKRPEMGRVAGEEADLIVVTTDNPRGEDPAEIAREILVGVPDGARDRTRVVLDRREAIAAALAWAESGDVVVVAGKGHEQGQVFRDKVIPFDDVQVVREELARLGWEG